jgi:3-oxoacyl-[acyl-carrier protein] reductase
MKKNKIALVTGSTRGIGRSVCIKFAKQSIKIIGCSRNLRELNSLKKELDSINKSNNFMIQLDLSKKNSVKKLLSRIRDKKLLPDIIVNNVGGKLNFTDPLGPIEQWQKVMRINVEAAIEINRGLIPYMRKKKWGRICHVSSISALENQGPPAYCASKAALNAYVRSVGRYVATDNIIMTSIMPGPVLSKNNDWDKAKKNRPNHVKKFLQERIAIKRFANENEISDVIDFLCSEKSSFCVGSCFLVDGGQGRVFYPTDF